MTNIYLISKHNFIQYLYKIKHNIELIWLATIYSPPVCIARLLHSTVSFLVVLGPVYTSIVFTHFFHGSLHFLQGTVWLVNGSVLFVKDKVRLLHGTFFFLHGTLRFVFRVYTWKHVWGSVFYHWANVYYGKKCLCS